MVLKTVLVLLLPLNSLAGTVEPAKRTGLVLGSVPAPVASGACALVPMQYRCSGTYKDSLTPGFGFFSQCARSDARRLVTEFAVWS